MSACDKRKHAHFLNVAMQCANKARHMKSSHGAVLVKGSKIIATGSNSYTVGRTCQRGNVHAEVSCLRNASMPKDSACLIMYIVRVNALGDLRESKPCSNCQLVLRRFNITTVFHSAS
jgi:deoxycytidylate deaminase